MSSMSPIVDVLDVDQRLPLVTIGILFIIAIRIKVFDLTITQEGLQDIVD